VIPACTGGGTNIDPKDGASETKKLKAKAEPQKEALERVVQEITAEQARAALLQLRDIRVITGGEDDPIFRDLKTSPITRADDSRVTIGKFISCNLKENTWRMELHNDAIHFHAKANGRFERQLDGSWKAIQTSGYIT
jgi:hypothetical protein